jgi:hypothetical protein
MTEKEVKHELRINRKKWADFCKYMRGQTVGIDSKGKINYYEWDVDRFINNLPQLD